MNQVKVIVDPDAINVDILKRALTRLRYHVISADGGLVFCMPDENAIHRFELGQLLMHPESVKKMQDRRRVILLSYAREVVLVISEYLGVSAIQCGHAWRIVKDCALDEFSVLLYFSYDSDIRTSCISINAAIEKSATKSHKMLAESAVQWIVNACDGTAKKDLESLLTIYRK